MVRTVLLSVVACVALSGSALGDASVCVAPFAPVVPNGATATKEQMLAAQKAVTTFLAQSDEYQLCVGADLKTQQVQAQHDQKTLDVSVSDRARSLIDDNQSQKEDVGAEYNTAVQAYKAAHPATPSSH